MKQPNVRSLNRHALMREFGYVLLNWSVLERAVVDDIRRLRMVDGDSGVSTARARGSFIERLAEWRALASLRSRRNSEAALEVAETSSETERLCRIRNLLAHYVAGAEAIEEGRWVVLVSEHGVASARSQTAFTIEQLAELNEQMLHTCRRVADLRNVLGVWFSQRWSLVSAIRISHLRSLRLHPDRLLVVDSGTAASG